MHRAGRAGEGAGLVGGDGGEVPDQQPARDLAHPLPQHPLRVPRRHCAGRHAVSPNSASGGVAVAVAALTLDWRRRRLGGGRRRGLRLSGGLWDGTAEEMVHHALVLSLRA